MADQLLQYIIAQEHAGYHEEQIRATLATQGYTKEQLDAAFKELGSTQTDSIIREYVQQYGRQGSTPVQIFQALTQQGYPAGKVRRAIIEVFGPGTLPNHHTAIFLTIALVIAIGGIYFINPGGILDGSTGAGTGGGTGGGPVEFTPADQIAQVIIIAKSQGKDAGVKECEERLRNDNRDLCLLDIAILDEVNDDKLCDRITDVKYRDACLVHFIDASRPDICKRLRIQENINTCNALLSIQRVPST